MYLKFTTVNIHEITHALYENLYYLLISRHIPPFFKRFLQLDVQM